MTGLPAQSVIITGGNTGLGYQCAKAIASVSHNWQVIIASRNLAKAVPAVEQLKRETGNNAIEVMHLDLASLASIRGFAKSFAEGSFAPLHALVCNAGISVAQGVTYTEDGFETTFGVNHLGHFLLVNLLLRSLVAPARIVFVSSGTHDPNFDGRISPPSYQNAKKLAWPEKDGERPLPGLRRYSTSKLCNMFCTYELARRLQAEGLSTPEHRITVNAYDPGATPGTGLIRDYPSFVQGIWRSPASRFLLGLLGTKIYDLQTSGNAMARLVLDPSLEGVTGKYFHVRQEMRSSKESYDTTKARELWESSVELVKLTADETLLSLPHPV